MRNWFRKGEPPVPKFLLEEAERALPHLTSLRDHPGWELVRGWIVEETNGAIGEWVLGVLPDRSIELAARVKAFDWVLGLLDSRIEAYRNVFRDEGREESTDSATTAFLDPHDSGEA